MPNRVDDGKLTEWNFLGPDHDFNAKPYGRKKRELLISEKVRLQLEEDKQLFDLIWPNVHRKPIKIVIKSDEQEEENSNFPTLKVDQYVRSWKRRRISKLIREAFDPKYKETKLDNKKLYQFKKPIKKKIITTIDKWDDTGKDLTILRDFSLCWKLRRMKPEKIALRPVPVNLVQLITQKSSKYPNKRPRVVLEISSESKGKLGRLIISLYSDYVPKMCKKFLSLCEERNINTFTYKGCPFTMILSGFFCKTGDVSGLSEDFNGSYGRLLKEEDLVLSHGEAGVLTVHPNTPEYQFYITFRKMKSFDGNHVAFGKIVKGMETLKEIEKFGSTNGKPTDLVYISNCCEI